MPEQGQAVLCLWLSPCLGDHSCVAPLSTHSMRAGWVGDLWPAVQVGSIRKGGYLLWCPPRNESRPHPQYREENSSRQAGRELWCIWITNRLRGGVWGLPERTPAPWHRPSEGELSLGAHLLITKQYFGKRNTAHSCLFNSTYML